MERIRELLAASKFTKFCLVDDKSQAHYSQCSHYFSPLTTVNVDIIYYQPSIPVDLHHIPHVPEIMADTERKRKWDDDPEEKPTLDAAAQAGESLAFYLLGVVTPADSFIPSHLIPSMNQLDSSYNPLLTAAVAARIASLHGAGSGSPVTAVKEEKKDIYDGAFTHNIDINDLRNRYLITKGSTQQEVSSESSLGLGQ